MAGRGQQGGVLRVAPRRDPRRGPGDGDLARPAAPKTIVGLQARSDLTLMYARDLLHEATRAKSDSVQARCWRGASRCWAHLATHIAATPMIAGNATTAFSQGELTRRRG